MMKRFKALSLLLIGGFLAFGTTTFNENDSNIKSLAASDNDIFKRISAVSDLADGDEIIFVNQAETYACGTTQNTNNRTPESIKTANNSYTYSSDDNIQTFIVKKNGSNFGFHTGSGYIYSASSSKNYLNTNTTALTTAPSGTSAWTMTVSSNVFTIKNSSNTSYYLAFNSTSYFSQYSSGQSKPYIYKKQSISLKSIAISGTPTKTTYQAGEELDPTGLVVKGTYSDESEKTITTGIEWTLDPETLSVGDTSCDVMASVGEVVSEIYTVTGLTVTEPLILESIAVSGTPSTTSYIDGQTFNTAGLTATATYTNKTTADVTADAAWTVSPNILTTGTTKVNVVASLNEINSPSYEVSGLTVVDNYVKTLSWTNRGTVETFAGKKISDLSFLGSWTFKAYWADETETSPTFGTGEDNVHISLYAESSPDSENIPLSSDYQFKLEDNGKYIIACYKNKFSTLNKKIGVIQNVNSIIGVSSEISSFKWTASQNDNVYKGSGNITAGDYTFSVERTGSYESWQGGSGVSNGYHKIGTSGSPTHNLTLTSTTSISNMSKIIFWIGYYTNPTDITIKVGESTITSAKTLTKSGISEQIVSFDNDYSGILTIVISSTTGRSLFKSFEVGYKGTEELANKNYNAQKAALDFATQFKNNINGLCEGGMNSTKWATVKGYYDTYITNSTNLSDSDKAVAIKLLKFANTTAYSGGSYTDPDRDIIQEFATSYEWIVNNYGSSKLGADCDFAKRFGSDVPTGANAIKLFGSTNQNTIIAVISGIAILGATSFGVLLILKRKKKEN